ncbi:MAG: hypothetical protein KBG75_01145 [Pseudomonadales bacterium]|nr:hypothetical protein [Pseudomonadales bacterium]
MEPFGPVFEGDQPAHAALQVLLDALQQRHAGSVMAVLFYGSCLRSGDLSDGLVDLYVIVRGYRQAHTHTLSAMANRVLAPNVYYLQRPVAELTVRCKYAVLSIEDLERGVSRNWFESYIWGRFSQPVALAYSADGTTRTRVRACLRRAVITLLDRTLPCAPPQGTISELWERSLALSYATELRAEGSRRPATLVEYGAGFFQQATQAVATELRWPFEIDGASYRATPAPAVRRRARMAWALRRICGKLLSVLRLLKALFTFEGGFDYIAWKLERHSGRAVNIPARVRKYPLIFVWGFMWRLYREGVLR